MSSGLTKQIRSAPFNGDKLSYNKVDKLSLLKAEELSPAAMAEEFSLIEAVPKKEAESSTTTTTRFGLTEEKKLNPVVQEQLCWIILYTHSHIRKKEESYQRRFRRTKPRSALSPVNDTEETDSAQ